MKNLRTIDETVRCSNFELHVVRRLPGHACELKVVF